MTFLASIATWLTAHGSQIFQMAADVSLSLCILGTSIAKSLGKSYPMIDSTESKLKTFFTQWLPQFGVHPQINALQAAYDDVKAQLDAVLAAQAKSTPDAPSDSKPAA